jgi:peptidoglycan LD-endopeptidase LytH
MVKPAVRLEVAASFFSMLLAGFAAGAQPFLLPTANRALFEPGGEERFFVGTVGRTWTSGTYGCVRSEGWQFHEGIDIRSVQRDRQGEPIDPVTATASGTVAYISAKPSLSNYGNYIVLWHRIEGMEIFSLYAHLREIRPGLKPGKRVEAGDVIGTLGRTANTREGISRDRAHVHFELNLLVNDRFATWLQKTIPGSRNDHGDWNGQNLLGLDPHRILLAQQTEGAKFSLVRFVRQQTELCRVFVRETDFPWARRYGMLIRSNSRAQEGFAGYEIALNYAGIPFELTPRSAAEMPGTTRFQLLSVNEEEARKNPCRRLVTKKGNRWELGENGVRLLELLAY